jgi:hypothetical protein
MYSLPHSREIQIALYRAARGLGRFSRAGYPCREPYHSVIDSAGQDRRCRHFRTHDLQLIDPEGRSPNALFLRNAMDYLNENVEMIQMRAKDSPTTPWPKPRPPSALS